MRELWRIAQWGLLGTAALVIAAYAASTETGRDRIRQAAGQFHQFIKPSGGKLAQPFDAEEGKRLAETVRLLAADRDRLLARIAALEHSVDRVTGSIAPPFKPAPAAQHPPAPEPTAAPVAAAPATSEPVTTEPAASKTATSKAMIREAPISEPATSEEPASEPTTMQAPPSEPVAKQEPASEPPMIERTTSAPASDITSSIHPLTARAVPTLRYIPAPLEKPPTAARPAAAHVPASNTLRHTNVGVALGNPANTMNDLSELWETSRKRSPEQLGRLHPVALVQEQTRSPGGTEYQLIAGPIANMAAAVRLCNALSVAAIKCKPVTYDGRLLAGR
jgi:hypothetical protein